MGMNVFRVSSVRPPFFRGITKPLIRMVALRTVGDKNKHRYVVATQSQPLRSKLRSIPAVPILHMTRSVMILEPPSDTTLRAKALVCHHPLHRLDSSHFPPAFAPGTIRRNRRLLILPHPK